MWWWIAVVMIAFVMGFVIGGASAVARAITEIESADRVARWIATTLDKGV